MAKILIAEDSQLLLKIARAMLEKAGHAVLDAVNGEVAVRLAKENKPDVIILDAEMPVMGGLEALRALKADTATAAIPVYIYSGHEPDGAEAKAMLAAGAAGVHVKPYQADVLISLAGSPS